LGFTVALLCYSVPIGTATIVGSVIFSVIAGWALIFSSYYGC